MTCLRTIVAAVVVLAGLPGQIAFADDATDIPSRLPGVDASAGETVVGVDRARTNSTAEPEPDRENGWMRVGDWDVKISGEITYDIGTKKLSPNNR